MTSPTGSADDDENNGNDGTAFLFQGLTPPARSADPRPMSFLTPPVYNSPILSPPVLVSDPSKSDATAAVAVAAEINNPEIEVNEADDNSGGVGVNFMVYAGAVFSGLLLVEGGRPYY